jgi:hypothetical protein
MIYLAKEDVASSSLVTRFRRSFLAGYSAARPATCQRCCESKLPKGRKRRAMVRRQPKGGGQTDHALRLRSRVALDPRTFLYRLHR